MSRFRGPKGKIVRRFGVNIYGNPKFDRLLARRQNPPGMHGGFKGRRKISEYGKQLIEKQKLKYTYGLRERQFRITFKRALRHKGITGDNLMIMLESRLDNTVFRMGMAPSRDAARQLILHGHLKVNNRRVNIASFQVTQNDTVTVKESTRSRGLVQRYVDENISAEIPEWVSIDRDNLKATVDRVPLREEIPTIANEQLIVELYSK
ncbi:MAG TPA: 30S ribosomal protein S4 [Lentisphaeria bacterium]|nr:30S ribosomal protein S4 [Lentisphaeria bacterium]|tara:strand:+ start:3474 stop:4094 length:621 start_codon:yes stop_codon:yes gene_type:complete